MCRSERHRQQNRTKHGRPEMVALAENGTRGTGTVDREKGETMDVLKVSGDGDLWTAKTRFNREMASGTLMCGHSV